jgi:hypothetical protein
VQVSTDNSTWTNITSIYRYDAGNPGWEEQIVDLSAYSAENQVYLGFLGVDGGYGDIIIDDINLEVPSAVEVYNQSTIVALGPGEELNGVIFPNWSNDWGSVENTSMDYFASSSVEIASDGDTSNDEETGYVTLDYPHYHDLGATAIITPTSGMGGVKTPVVTVENFGQYAETNEDLNVIIWRTEPDPNSWTQVVHSGTGRWEQWAYGSHTYEAGGAGLYYAGAQAYNSPDLFDVSLFTPSFDFSLFSNVSVVFWRNFQDYAGNGQGNISTYSGGTDIANFEEELWYGTSDDIPRTGIFTTLYFDPSTYADPSDVHIAWWYTDDSGGSTSRWGFSIDDLVITAAGFTDDFETGLVAYLYTEEYNETIAVSLDVLEEDDITCPDWTPYHFSNLLSGEVHYEISACVDMASDNDTSNDCQADGFDLEYVHDMKTSSIDEPSYPPARGDTFYACNLHNTPQMLVSFDSENPDPFTDIAPIVSFDFLSGACFVEETWYASEYSVSNSNIWTVDETTGDMVNIGTAGVGLHGLAYDGATLYGCSDAALYSVDTSTGAATMIGPFLADTSVMIGIACDSAGNMYGEDLGTDKLYSIDTSTGEATEIGPVGINLNYAQDIAYDKDNDVLYSTGYKGSGAGGGALGTLDTSDGHYTFIGNFPIGDLGCPAEVDAFAIPYTASQGYIEPGTYPVEATVEDACIYPEGGFEAEAKIYRVEGDTDVLVYIDDEIIVSIAAGEQRTIEFDDWVADVGTYRVEVETKLPGDDIPENDKKTKSIICLIPDFIPPVTTHELDGIMGGDGWFVSPVEVTLTAVDENSGVKETWYVLDGGSPVEYTAPFEVSDDGNHELIYWSVDNWDNREDNNTATFKIDQTPPTTSAEIARGVPVTITLTATDEHSGVDDTFYKIDAGGWETYTGPFDYSETGDHTLYFYSVDNAGNEEDLKSEEFTVESAGELEIGAISGGIGKVSAEINSSGGDPVENVVWTIEVDGGLVRDINITSEGNFSEIAAGGSELVKTDKFILGLGGLDITVTADADNADEVTAETTGFVLLFLVIVQ